MIEAIKDLVSTTLIALLIAGLVLLSITFALWIMKWIILLILNAL